MTVGLRRESERDLGRPSHAGEKVRLAQDRMSISWALLKVRDGG